MHCEPASLRTLFSDNLVQITSPWLNVQKTTAVLIIQNIHLKAMIVKTKAEPVNKNIIAF